MYERDPVAIERWKTQEFPKLRARAKRLGARILFLGEAGVRSDQILGRTSGIRGQTPEVATSGRRGRVFMVLDGHPAHGARIASEYVQSFRGKLELHFLLKKQGVSKKPLRRDDGFPVLVARLARGSRFTRRAPEQSA